MNHMTGICLPLSDPRFTPKQGQYLAFIYAYTQVLGRPPAEADLQRHFRVSPPSVHQMVLTLERAGLIRRTVGGPRSIEILVDPEALPVLRPAQEQPVKSSVQRYSLMIAGKGLLHRNWPADFRSTAEVFVRRICGAGGGT
jgi:SOS-response transcriptional repressor LexA